MPRRMPGYRLPGSRSRPRAHLACSPRPGIGHGATFALGILVLAAGCLHAQPPDRQSAEDDGRFEVEASLDVASRYLFRGHEKDERGVVMQPAVGVGYAFHSAATGLLRELSVGGLVWSSVHAGTRGYAGDLGVFEVDLGLSLDAELSNGWTAGVLYTSYIAPTGAFAHIHEIGVELGFGSLGAPGTLTLSPRLLLAQEISDTGGTEDTYLEVGGDLELPPTGVLQWAVPVVVGMSVDGFYRDAAGDNLWLGFLETGVKAHTSLVDLGIGRLPGTLTAGVTLAFVNRGARLTHEIANDLLWTTRVGLSLGL